MTLYTPHLTLSTVHPSLHFTLYTLHFTLHTRHFTHYTLLSTLYTPHSTLYTLHFTLHTLHSTLHTLHVTLYTPHSSLHTLHATLHTLHSTLDTLHTTLYSLHFTLHTLHCTHYTLHSTLLTLHSIPCTLHFTLLSHRQASAPICNLHPAGSFASQQLPKRASLQIARPSHALSSLQSNHMHRQPRTSPPDISSHRQPSLCGLLCYTLHSTLYTVHTTTLHSTLFTLHSIPYTLHFTLLSHRQASAPICNLHPAGSFASQQLPKRASLQIARPSHALSSLQSNHVHRQPRTSPPDISSHRQPSLCGLLCFPAATQ